MTSVQSHALQPSPWLSVWLSPRSTIERIIASNPRCHVLLLASLGAASTIVSTSIGAGRTTELLDWRTIAVVAVGSAIFGIANLYIAGFFLKWSGRLLGGRASAVEMRAVFAWGFAPSALSLALYIVALIALTLRGGADVPPTPVVALQAIGGILGLWSLVATMLMLGRVQGFGFWRTTLSFVFVYLGSVLLLLLVLFVRTFFFQPFNIPSGAMKPTLLVGDYIFVSKFPYGYSNYSLPFSLQLISGRIFASEPHPGDVVVFRLPRDPSIDYVKRVVALPGDTVQMIGGLLHINGQPVKRERIEDFVEPEERKRPSRVKQWRETLPNGVSYATIDFVDNGFYDNTPLFQVPAGHYFMLGDNRDNSTDSRVRPESGGVGYVPLENIVGRAEIIFLSIDRDDKARPAVVRFERIGSIVR
jgi:signal peptidase I